jgi:hypothetical protein
MKKTILVLVVLLLVIIYSCKEKIDFEKEKSAIMAVVEEETASYYASDFDRWCAVHVQDSDALRLYVTKTGFSVYPGWDSISPNLKASILSNKEARTEVKTPIRIKIYGESAWVVFDNKTTDSIGKYVGDAVVTNFLEKHDGKWKIVLRNSIATSSYYQTDRYLIYLINYARSLGKDVEDIAGFMTSQVKPGQDPENDYKNFVNGMLSNWRAMVPKGDLKILERDDNHIVFSADNMLTGIKRNGPQLNVTYDDYLAFYRLVFEKVAGYMSAAYKQETTADGVVVTISKK